MDIMVGQVALGVYAALLIGGGYIGYAKAGSRSSLLSGIFSGGITIVALVISVGQPTIGFWIAAVLAVMMLAFFVARLMKTRKFMPSGVMALTSLVVAAMLIYLAAQPKGVGPG